MTLNIGLIQDGIKLALKMGIKPGGAVPDQTGETVLLKYAKPQDWDAVEGIQPT